MKTQTGSGAVFWITGLPRSGKTTLARALCCELRRRRYSVVALDGDAFRKACGDDLGYDENARLKNAQRLSAMCDLLSAQGLLVVCSTVSLITDIHALNRRRFPRYVEVLLKVPHEILRARDPALYNAAEAGRISLPGVNQNYSFPEHPDFIFEQATGELNVDEAVLKLLNRFGSGRL